MTAKSVVRELYDMIIFSCIYHYTSHAILHSLKETGVIILGRYVDMLLIVLLLFNSSSRTEPVQVHCLINITCPSPWMSTKSNAAGRSRKTSTTRYLYQLKSQYHVYPDRDCFVTVIAEIRMLSRLMKNVIE